MDFQELNNLDGLQFMPVTIKKQPVVKGWQTLFKKHNLLNCEAVGLVCGKLSGGIEVIDIDQKYSLDGKLYENYKRLINEINPDIIPKLVIQKTMNGGFHFIYRCEKIEGNLKLASRSTTNDEKNKTYLEEIAKNVSKEESKKRATNDKVRVLLETRGEGGMVVCFPSKGYEFIQGDWYSITELTLDERETLFNIARQFNEVIEDYRPQNKTDNRKGIKGLSPFEDYNDRGDVVSLLEKNGWKVVKNQGRKTLLLRPGQTSATHSGNYDFDKKWFSVFTTSTEFEPQKAYQPYAVYAILECNKDFSAASKKLYEEGYGDRHEVQRELNQSTPSRVSLIDDDYSFVATEEDFGEYLALARSGNLPMGLTTGCNEIDRHFLYKLPNMVMVNGEDNVGKTAVIVWFAIISALHHKWNWILYASENSEGSIMRRLIEFYWGKKINEQNDIEYRMATEFIKDHFTLIKTDEQLYNARDIINMTKKLLKKKKYHAVLIDPYNSLKLDLINNKISTHEYHYESVSELKMFGKKNKVGFWINNHVITGALRNKDENGYTKAPGKADTEGGGKFSNKADEFLTIHRHLQHPTEWMITEIHVRKVKETETGGRVTPKEQPIKIILNKTMCGFTVMNEMGYSNDPIKSFHSKNILKQTEIILPTYDNWTPYVDKGEPDPF